MAFELPSPLIVGFVADLMFQVKIELTAERLDYKVSWIERSNQLAQLATNAAQMSPDEMLIERLSDWQPALMILDLGNQEIPWRSWVTLIKSTPATRRIPLICYGSHEDAESLQAARRGGADIVLARSRFVTDLAELIQKYGRIPAYAAVQDACKEPLSIIARHGIELFNLGEYFEAHEYLEQAWNEDSTPGREFYRAILQVAVAYLQIERRNYQGAVKMFWRLRQWIDPLPDECRGVNVAKLREDARQVYEALVRSGNERIAEFDRNLFKPVEFE
jgi:uncharacterized protein